MNNDTLDAVLRYLADFASRFLATFAAVLLAGVLLLLGVREYVKSEVREAGQRMQKAIAWPPPR